MIKELYIIKQALFHAPFPKQGIDDVGVRLCGHSTCRAFPFLIAQSTANFNLHVTWRTRTRVHASHLPPTTSACLSFVLVVARGAVLTMMMRLREATAPPSFVRSCAEC
jgi:hypothetical protein